MKISNLILPALLASAVVGAVAVQQGWTPTGYDRKTVEESPVALLYAQPVTLEEPTTYLMRADQPVVSAGYLVVVQTNPAILPVRQAHNPILFAGDMPVERINGDDEPRVFIGFVPSGLDARGGFALDLARTPLYWAYPEVLPESLKPDLAQAALANALAGGAAPQAKERVGQALAAGGPVVHLGTYGDLRRHAASVIEQFSPGETDLIAGLRVPQLLK
jgi:hypothetical protein